MPIINTEQVNDYYKHTNMRHSFYKESVEKYHDLHDHYVDKVNMTIITERRPNESEEIKDYRQKIAVPISKGTLWKIISVFSEIRKAKDWNVNYEEARKATPAIIREEERPEVYLEEKIPIYKSTTNWLFSTLLNQYCIDANAVVVTMPPITQTVTATEYVTPVPVIYNSDQVIDYKRNEYYVLLSKETVFYNDGDRKEEGQCYYVIEKDFIYRYDQTSRSGDFLRRYVITNTTGRLPVHHLFGVIMDDNGLNVLSDSRISPVVPYLKELQRINSDFQAETTQNVFTLFWYLSTQECRKCKGAGEILKKSKTGEAIKTKCPSCDGHGRPGLNPYESMRISPERIGAGDKPVLPPAGHIARDIEVARFLNELVNQHKYDATSVLNFQSMDQVPIGQSGIAKETDRKEKNNILHSAGEDVVRLKDLVEKDINDWRYSGVVKDEKKRDAMLPKNNVPDKFDIVSSQMMLQDIQNLVNSKADPSVILSMQIDFVEKQFSAEPAKARRIIAVLELNPFPGKSQEEVATGVTFGLIDKTDAIIYNYLPTLIEKAIEDDDNFLSLKMSEKREKLKELALEIITEPEEEEKEDETIPPAE